MGNPDGSVTLAVTDSVATVTLTVPALTLTAKTGLLDALRRVADDRTVRAVVLTGTGRVFCAGQDLHEHAEALHHDAAHAFDTVAEHYNPVVLALADLPLPVVAAVNGTCAGAGLGLALACDVRICSSAAAFTTAFAGIGLTADTGLSLTLARAVGAARASELLLLAERFDAGQAHAWGLVGQVVEPVDVLTEATALARRLAGGPTLAYAEIKRGLRPSLADTLAAEHAAQARLGVTADHRGAVEAFLAKQRPAFEGR